MKSIAIVLAGQKISIDLSSFDYVICADGGYNNLPIGYKPDLLVGDFDSISILPQGIDSIRLNCEKNNTDGEIALMHAMSLLPSSIVIFCDTF